VSWETVVQVGVLIVLAGVVATATASAIVEALVKHPRAPTLIDLKVTGTMKRDGSEAQHDA
jgi:hypothetical protein